jgi:SAM-dependent methyltransferase
LTVYAGASDRWHEDYELGRPGWPAEVVEIPEAPAQSTVLELGPGTGKLTRHLVRRFDRVVAVEPDEGMRRLLVELVPGAELVAGQAETIPLADDSVDVVFVGEAFHVFDGAAAVAEIERVLPPGGKLVLLWNVPGGATDPSVEAAERLLLERAPDVPYDPVDLNTRRYWSGDWRAAFDDSGFGELHEVRLSNPQTIDREGLLAFYASMGWFSELPDDERPALLDQVRSLLPAEVYRRRWETHVHWARLADQRKDRSEMPHAHRPV